MSLGLLLGISVVGVLIPFYFPSGHKGDTLLSFGNSFAGGVMLGAGFLHMLVDASDDLATLVVFNSTTMLPHMLCVGGILIPFALEKGGLLCCRPPEEDDAEDEDKRVAGRSNSVSHSIGLDSRAQMHASLAAVRRRLNKSMSDYGSAEPSGDTSIGAADAGAGQAAVYNVDALLDSQADVPPSVRFANFMVLVILSIHSVLAGLAVGVAGSASGFGILIALLIHKLFEALVMGVSTVKARHGWKTRVTEIVIYVLATPMGVLAGLIISSFGTIPVHVVGVIVGLSSGTFIYIALVEIMCEEFDGATHRVVKFLMFVAGTLGMAVLGVYV